MKLFASILVLLSCFLSHGIQAQINKHSLDLGINGSFNSSALTISLGGNSIQGGLSRIDFSSQLGYFLRENTAVGLRYSNTYNYFWVERQHFNASTGQYEPFEQTEKAFMLGLYGRYYFDLSNYFSFFGHLEVGFGNELVEYTEEDDNGVKQTIDFERDLSDYGISAGIALRPSSNVGLELQIMRRFVQESYDVQIAPSSTFVQIEAYEGYELRIGTRINFDLVGKIKERQTRKIRPF